MNCDWKISDLNISSVFLLFYFYLNGLNHKFIDNILTINQQVRI